MKTFKKFILSVFITIPIVLLGATIYGLLLTYTTYTIIGLVALISTRKTTLGKLLEGPFISGIIIGGILFIWDHHLKKDTDLMTYGERIGKDYTSAYQKTEWESKDYYAYSPYQEDAFPQDEFVSYICANALGLNDKDYAPRTDSSVRILSLGDSFTEGVGAIGDSSYPKILQTLLTGTEVIGAGIRGSDPFFELKLAKKLIPTYNPTVVTVAINATDIQNVITRGGFERFAPNGAILAKKAPRWESWFIRSYVLRFLCIKLLNMDFFLIPPFKKEQEYLKTLSLLKESMDHLYVLCKTRGIRCIFLFHPGDPGEFFENKLICEPLLHYAKQKNYEYVDVFNYFKKQGVQADNCYDYYWYIDRHNNNQGYALFAKGVAEYINNSSMQQAFLQ